MNEVTITLSLPDKSLSPNARVHWAEKARVVKHHRHAAYVTAVTALKTGPRWPQATLHITAYFRTSRMPDADNFIASLKAYCDGIADAGIIENDRGLWPARPKFHKDSQRPRVELRIVRDDEP